MFRLLLYGSRPNWVLIGLLLALTHALESHACNPFSDNFTSVTSGDWATAATWGNTGNNVPGNNDNVKISSGDVVFHNNNLNIRRLDIQNGGELQSNGTFRTQNTYILNGVHSGTGDVRIQGNAVDSIFGTGVVSVTGSFRVDNPKQIYAGSDISINNVNLRLPNNNTITNAGTLRLNNSAVVGNGSGTLLNASGANLFISSTNVIGNGNIEGGTLNNTITFNKTTAGNQTVPALASGYYDLVIAGSNASTKVTDGELSVLNDLTIQNTTFSVVDTFSIKIVGDFVNNGTFDAANGIVRMVGSNPQTLQGGFDFNDLNINNGGSTVTISSDTAHIHGLLRPVGGTLITQGLLHIVSDASGDASIGPVSGAVSGIVYIERYIDLGATNWHFMSSPVSGATFAQWNDDFITSGFSGSDFPNFKFTSILGYDETVAGHQDSGAVEPSSVNDPIQPESAYWVWCGDSLGGTAPFTIDMLGPINSGTIDYGVSYTTTIGGITADGWNLVSNPYPSAIDWDSPDWTKTNIDSAIYIWNADMDQYAAYIDGVSYNSATNIVPMGQGFYVKAYDLNPVLEIQETCKSDVSTAEFLETKQLEDLIIRLFLSTDDFADETVFRLNKKASKDFDRSYDAYYINSEKNPLRLSSESSGYDFAINSLWVEERDTIDINMVLGEGQHTLNPSLQNDTGGFCIGLLDRTDKTIVPLSKNSEGITIPTDGHSVDRYALVISSKAEKNHCDLSTDINYIEGSNIELEGVYYSNQEMILSSDIPIGSHYTLFSPSGALIMQGVIDGLRIPVNGVSPGIYLFSITEMGLSVKVPILN